jgi:hypothetical protein
MTTLGQKRDWLLEATEENSEKAGKKNDHMKEQLPFPSYQEVKMQGLTRQPDGGGGTIT